jgi:hypothetical protein
LPSFCLESILSLFRVFLFTQALRHSNTQTLLRDIQIPESRFPNPADGHFLSGPTAGGRQYLPEPPVFLSPIPAAFIGLGVCQGIFSD